MSGCCGSTRQSGAGPGIAQGDGATLLPAARKRAWTDAAYTAGQREIKLGSFVPACLLPQRADSAEVLVHAKTLPGLSVLVPHFSWVPSARWSAGPTS